MPSPERRPDFFIVGAPKCGTTALSEYLRAHPRVFVSVPKEPFFFCDDFPGLPRVATLRDYLELFQGAREDVLAVGEASALYLYSDVATSKLRCFAPEARVLVMLRNPIELAHAFHSEMLYSQNEDEEDFSVAWELQSERRLGHRVPPTCWEPALLQYRDVAQLGSQLERLLAVFPAEQVHTILFDDFARDPHAIYEQVLAFLGVPSDERSEFPRINENKRVRYRWLARITQRPPRVLSEAARATKRWIGRERLHFLAPLRRANLWRGTRSPLPAGLRARLAGEFAAEVTLLSRLLDRDLSHWLGPAEKPSPGSLQDQDPEVTGGHTEPEDSASG